MKNTQNVTKIAPKTHIFHKNELKDTIKHPKWCPEEPQDLQSGAKEGPRASKESTKRPKGLQKGPQGLQKRPQGAPKKVQKWGKRGHPAKIKLQPFPKWENSGDSGVSERRLSEKPIIYYVFWSSEVTIFDENSENTTDSGVLEPPKQPDLAREREARFLLSTAENLWKEFQNYKTALQHMIPLVHHR